MSGSGYVKGWTILLAEVGRISSVLCTLCFTEDGIDSRHVSGDMLERKWG